jgi:DNA-binding helix-hairpin-helix protein with protein kinase domain
MFIQLALIIFKMVMQGFHPFQGVPNTGVPYVEQAHVYCDD